MQMDFGHWEALRSAMHDDPDGPRGRPDRRTLRRVATFARPHRRSLVAFLVLSSATALLTVLTPVLAGQVVGQLEATATGGGSSPWP